MTRLIAKTLVIVVLLALLLPSCSSEDDSPENRIIKVTVDNGVIQITDSVGRVVSLEQSPERIVSLAPSNTEVLYALGLEDKIVGVTSYCNYPVIGEKKPSENKPQVGGYSTVDIEQVVAQTPDLVLAARKHHDNETIAELERHGLKVIALIPETVEEVIQVIEAIGKVTETESTASQLVKDMESRLDAVHDLVKDLSDEEKPRIFYVVWHDAPKTAGYDTLQNYVVEQAGGKNIFDDLTEYPVVSLEEIVERDPQIIIVNLSHGSSGQQVMDWAETDDQIKDTSARKNGKVFSIHADIVSRGGPRIVDGIEEMIQLIHPDLAE